MPYFKKIFLGLLILFFTGGVCFTRAEGPKKVFILHSHEADDLGGQPQYDGVVAALKDADFKPGANMVLKVYHMDTGRNHGTSEQITAQAKIALEMIADFKPDVLVTLDDNAFETVGLTLSGTGLPVVFSGMNGQPEDYDKQKEFMKDRQKPGGNITGVYEKLYIADAFRIYSRISSELYKIRIFVDQSPAGKAIARQIELELTNAELPCEWDIVVSETWEEYKKNFREGVRDPRVGAFYLAALLFRDVHGYVYTAPQIFAWTLSFSDKPEMALNNAFTRLGLFGGAAVDFFAMGKQAGEMAAKILNGASAGNIPIEDAKRYALAFNLKRAKWLGITIPEDILLKAGQVVEE